LDLRVRESATDDVAHDRRSTQADVGRAAAQKHASRGARAPTVAEMLRQRVPYIGEQRQMLDDATFAANDQLTGPPTNVIELEKRDLSCPESESGEQQYDGVIATTDRGRLVRRGQHTIDVFRREERRDRGVPVLADRRDR